MSFFDWLGRVIMLVLAGMITLSIIGSIAAIPSGSSIERQIVERTDWPRAQPPEQGPQAEARPPQAPPPERRQAAPERVRQVPVPAIAAAPPPQLIDPARWLEVIAHALLALAGLGALGVVIAWRSLHQRKRIADALEALSLK